MFPNGGLAVRPRGIIRVRDADGSTAFAPARRDASACIVARRSPIQMVSMLQDVVDRGTGVVGAAPGRALPGRRQDRHHRRLQGRVVRRLLARRSSSACGWASISRRRSAREAYGARYALPIWADFMRRAARVRPPGTFERPAGLARGNAVRASRTCSRWTAARSTPSTSRTATTCPSSLCPLHRGTIRQRVARTVQGWVSEVGPPDPRHLPLSDRRQPLLFHAASTRASRSAGSPARSCAFRSSVCCA